MSDEDIEVDGGQVVRPERFILPEVTGMAIPLRVRRKGELVFDWRLMLRWRDGLQEQVPLRDCLRVDDREVFLRPSPGAPQAAFFDKWTRESREAWLRGDATMPPDEVCRRLIVAFAKHLDLPADTAGGTVAVLACWTVLTYIHPVFDSVPYLGIAGTLGSGKTRVLDLLEQVVFRPFATSSLSNSVLFRHLNTFGGTMLIDEGEQFGSRSPAVNEIFNSLLAGYKRGKTVSRSTPTADGDYEPHQFCVAGPKAIACIGEMIPALVSRAVPIPMIRALPTSQKIRLRIDESKAEWAALRDGLHAMSMNFGAEWLELPEKKDVCPEMHGRNYELWQPLLAIADWLDRHGATGLREDLRNHAIRTIEAGREVATPAEDEVVLRAIARLVEGQRGATAKEILERATGDEPSLFKNWSAKRVANCLRRYGLGSRKTRGSHVFEPSRGELLRVQSAHQIDLGIADVAIKDTQRLLPFDGAHGVHGVRVPEEATHAV
jgi:hypothetical protein